MARAGVRGAILYGEAGSAKFNKIRVRLDWIGIEIYLICIWV